MEKGSAMKVGIISSIVASLVMIFLQPLLGLVWDLIVGLGRNVHQGYVDSLYRNAALGERNLSSIVGVLMTQLLFIILATYYVTFRIADKVSNPKIVQRISLVRLIAITSLAVALMGCLIVVSLAMGISEIAASFNQRLTVLAPAIGDTEYKKLRAQWASMSTEKDYNALVAGMDSRAAELNIKLPKVREP